MSFIFEAVMDTSARITATVEKQDVLIQNLMHVHKFIFYQVQDIDDCCRYIQAQTGFRTISLTYHPFNQSLVEAAESAAEQMRELISDQAPVFGVAYSLGAVVLRHIMALAHQGGISWAGCVLISPPNHGRYFRPNTPIVTLTLPRCRRSPRVGIPSSSSLCSSLV
jgi:hypothetical protein